MLWVILPTLYRIFSKLLLHNLGWIYTKRKCEACSRLLQEGCGKTRTKINDTNPHTRMIWG